MPDTTIQGHTAHQAQPDQPSERFRNLAQIDQWLARQRQSSSRHDEAPTTEAPDCQPIGDALKRTLSTLQASVTALERSVASKPTSATTGSQSQEREAERPTGIAPGSDGAAQRLTAALQAGKLASLDPDQTDEGLRALLWRRWSGQLVRRSFSVPFAKGPMTYETMTWTSPPTTQTRRAVDQLLSSVCQSAAPADLAQWLTRLRVMTASQAMAAEDTKLAVTAYAESCCEYPADVVRATLDQWRRDSRWWPAWADLQSIFDCRCHQRRLLRQSLLEA